MNGTAKSAFVIASIAIALAALWLWIRNFDVSGAAFFDLLHRLRWAAIVPLATLLVGHVALSSWRWQLIEERLSGVRPQFSSAYASGAFALGLGTILPSPIVNITCRALANRYAGSSSIRGALSGTLDQLADFAVALLFAIPAVIALHQRDISLYLVGSAAAAVIGVTALAPLAAVGKWAASHNRHSWWRQIAPLLDRKILARLYGISLMRLANATFMNLLIQSATGAATASAVTIAVPIVTVATSVAMLPGAIGISEWSFSKTFSAFEIANPDIVTFVLANRILLTTLSVFLATTTLVAITVSLRRR